MLRSLARRGSPGSRRVSRGAAAFPGPSRHTHDSLVWASSPKAGRPLRPTHRLSYRACASRDPFRGPRGLDVGRACLGEEGGGGGSLPYGAHPTGAWPATRTEKKQCVCGGLALAAVRAPPGTQLSSLLRSEPEGGLTSPTPLCPPLRRGGLAGRGARTLIYPCPTPTCLRTLAHENKTKKTCTTLSGGSLGSCVDEERS